MSYPSESGEFPTPRNGVQSRFEVIDTNWVSCNVNGNSDIDCAVEGTSYDLHQLEMMTGAPASVPAIPVGSPIPEVDGIQHTDVEFMMDGAHGFEGDGTCVVFEMNKGPMKGRRQMVCGDRDDVAKYDFWAASEDKELADAIDEEL